MQNVEQIKREHEALSAVMMQRATPEHYAVLAAMAMDRQARLDLAEAAQKFGTRSRVTDHGWIERSNIVGGVWHVWRDEVYLGSYMSEDEALSLIV